ncbi:hypothetical protein DFH07DRAFT_973678 [Mycena maculata]|uniref:Uncharacterized protein n=1 Tax=Mycena maculata TaxID=230809 RepID=A0AAD7MI42_9AGAR|nr:hypothetical protein DFH07DRAFT_973678 [Mycena maculata]
MTQHAPSTPGTEVSASVPGATLAPSTPSTGLFGYVGSWLGLCGRAAPTAPPVNPNAPADTPATGMWFSSTVYRVVPTAHLTPLPYDNGELWYGILVGKFVGVTQNQGLALGAVAGISRNSMKSYKSQTQALDVFNHALDLGIVEIRPF